MSICFMLCSALSIAQTEDRIAKAQSSYADILSYFWISEVKEPPLPIREDAAEHGLNSQSFFMIQWNKERSELIRLIPKIFYDVFGKDKILVRNDDYEVIPPP